MKSPEITDPTTNLQIDLLALAVSIEVVAGGLLARQIQVEPDLAERMRASLDEALGKISKGEGPAGEGLAAIEMAGVNEVLIRARAIFRELVDIAERVAKENPLTEPPRKTVRGRFLRWLQSGE